jgi:hypothetical protein
MKHTLQRAVRHPRGAARAPVWLADDYLESYICWREECVAVRHAYALWRIAERPDRAMAFAAYGAALDREEQAARLLRERIERLVNSIG